MHSNAKLLLHYTLPEAEISRKESIPSSHWGLVIQHLADGFTAILEFKDS